MQVYSGFVVDQMLPVRLATQLKAVFPGTVHVKDVGLEGRSDSEIAKFADSHNLAVLTKDRDFERIMEATGAPRKVVWLSVGNMTNSELLQIVDTRLDELVSFLTAEERLLLFLRPQ
jgi:predicted nuclease of predicted toxin-antitoxin system